MSVQIKSSLQIQPQVYAYTTPTVSDNLGWIKIGYTEREVERRIKEQTHTANIESKILWHHDAIYQANPNMGEPFKDYDFHQFLRFHQIERRPKTEWFFFNGEPEKSEVLFRKFASHDTTGYQPGQGQDYILRFEQEEAVNKTLSYIRSNPGGAFLWNAKPRFGKTLASYELVRRLFAQNVLIVTNRPAIANSWFDDFDKFIAGITSYKFVSESESLKGRPVMSRQDFKDLTFEEGKADTPQIAFLSLQDLKGSIFFGGVYNKLEWVKQINWDLLIIDEAHEGVDTFKTDKAFENITRKFTLHLSGTPFKAIAKGDFKQDQIFNWSYADEQSAKVNWKSSDESENPYENLPQLNMFTYQMSPMIREHVKNGADIDGENMDFAFDLNEFFATKEDGTFIHKNDVLKWLDTLTGNEKYPFSTKELREELRHTFWYLDRVSSAKALKEMLESHPVFEHYHIVLAAGDGRSEDSEDDADLRKGRKSLDMVRQAIQEYDRAITISVGQLTTGVTIPEWSGVMMLNNLRSPALYMQAAFRAQNPHSWTSKGKHYRKERAYIFDFAPDRTLLLYDQFANNLLSTTSNGRGSREEHEENIKTLLNFFPVIAEDKEGKMIELDARGVMVIPKQLRATEVLKRGFMSNLLFDNITGIFQATQLVLDILDQLPVVEQGKISQSDQPIDLPDISFDLDGKLKVDTEIVISQNEKLFGNKIYELRDSIGQSIEAGKAEDKDFVSNTKKQIKDIIVNDIREEYGLTDRGANEVAKQIDKTIEKVLENNHKDQMIREADIRAEFDQKLLITENPDIVMQLKDEQERRIEENREQHRDMLSQNIQRAIENVSERLIEIQEIKKAERQHKDVQEEIRSHLRGFTRTIPSFIMAYGDKNLTLANFDTYVPDSVFQEVTGITIDQFRFLRDGGHDFEGHLFDEGTFDEAVQAFLNKKEELANYFEEHTEDIFDYIPPQQTNQIYTPKPVVKRMVDELQKENPNIFDDSTKTFIDLYMKSGLYITEIVKRLYRSDIIQAQFPDEQERIKHILENQVFGFAPTEIIFRIAVGFIFGNQAEKAISRKNFRLVDTVPFAKEGTVQELIDREFEE